MGIPSALYKTALAGRKVLYRIGIRKIQKLPFKVISVGNLTVGGTGKTPAVIAVALEAQKRGLKPCVLTRGYRGRTKGPCLADKGNKELFNTYQAGDETVLLVNRLGNIPVVKGKNRFLAGVYALGELGPDIIDTFILDDGFQHWALRRDVDVLLIDATNPFGNHKLFPEGILREPMNSMKRADICVITKSDMENQDEKTRILHMIRQYNSETPVFMAYHKPVCLMQASGETSSLNTLDHKKIYVFAGIANPSYFTFMLKSLGADIVKFKKFRDHHQYSQHDIQKIQKEAEGLDILTTEKDLVKLREIEFPQNLYALKIIFSVENGFYDILFKKISHFAD